MNAAQNAVTKEAESPSEIRLNSIRQLSNVAQALENVVVQCDGLPDLHFIRHTARQHLTLIRDVIFREIHRR